MKHLWIAVSFVLGSAVTSLQGALQRQDPAKDRPPAPPAGSPLLPTLEEPWVAPVIRSDLLQRFEPREPLEGFYELTRRIVNGSQPATMGRGWVVLGKRHMMLYLVAPGPKPSIPLVRASIRAWARQGDQLRTSVLAGHFNEADGDLVMEQMKEPELKRYELLGGMLRIYQSNDSYLDFQRIE